MTLLRHLARSRTIFVPKKGDPAMPCNYRPISIASIAIRHFHRILARRLEKLSLVDARQRAFRRADGVAENLFLLDSLLKDSRSSCKGLCLASLDLSKAFDSVSHESIYTTMTGVGLDQRFVDYIRGLYGKSETFLQVGSTCSRAIRPKAGVRQGDPLSPLLFNLVVDSGLRAIPDAVGYKLGKATVNVLAFADDVIIVAETPNGLRLACEAFTTQLTLAGLRLNPAKSASLTLVPSGRDRKVKTVDEVYSLGGTALPALNVASLWRYLGVGLTGGRTGAFDGAAYVDALARLTREPMRAQMRLAIVRDYLIPRFVHELTFSVVTMGKLRVLAHETRRAVRRWLGLPTSSPNAFIHSPTSAGGLGVPDFVIFVNKNRVNRLSKLENSSVVAVREAFRIHGSKALASARRAVEGRSLKMSAEQELHASVDGAGLKLCPAESASVAWLRKPHGIKARDFKRYVQIRINSLPTRKRVNRGKSGPTSCRACFAPSETLAHIAQNCQRTHEARLTRHDQVVNRLVASLRDKGYEVETEFLYRLHGGNLKPDIVATRDSGDAARGRVSVICDIQIVSAIGPSSAHANKVTKYDRLEDLKTAILARHRSTEVQTVVATLTWSGVWEPQSSHSLRALGLSGGVLGALVIRVLQGTILTWRMFNSTTTISRRRTGVG